MKTKSGCAASPAKCSPTGRQQTDMTAPKAGAERNGLAEAACHITREPPWTLRRGCDARQVGRTLAACRPPSLNGDLTADRPVQSQRRKWRALAARRGYDAGTGTYVPGTR